MVPVRAANTYIHTHKHSKDVTRHIKPNSRASRGFYLIIPRSYTLLTLNLVSLGATTRYKYRDSKIRFFPT